MNWNGKRVIGEIIGEKERKRRKNTKGVLCFVAEVGNAPRLRLLSVNRHVQYNT